MTTVEEILKNIGEEMADNEWVIDDPYASDRVDMSYREFETLIKKHLTTLETKVREEERQKVLEEVRGEIMKMWKPFAKATDCAAYHIHNSLLDKIVTKLNQLKK